MLLPEAPLPVAVVEPPLHRLRFPTPCLAPDLPLPQHLATVAAVASLAKAVALRARIERLAAGAAAREAERFAFSLVFVHAPDPRTPRTSRLTRSPASGTFRCVQRRVRFWIEGSGL
jgi:hypothetical protein